jgi:hypothetical protein
VIIGIVIRRTVKQHPEIKRGNIQRRQTKDKSAVPKTQKNRKIYYDILRKVF